MASKNTGLQQMPNIGPKIAEYLNITGVYEPKDLAGKDPYVLYQTLCKKTGKRYCPCTLDVFMAAVASVEDGKLCPWWHFIKKRKKLYPNL